MKKTLFTLVVIYSISIVTFAQKVKTDANIVGHVTAHGEHISYASVYVKGTTIGTATDETGHYQLVNLPTGKVTVVVKVVGFKTEESSVTLQLNETKEIKFELAADVMGLDEVVISSNRSESKRTDAPVIVNTISPKLFNTTQSVTLSEGLNFSPGLRMENNCQNCGFTQVRMNGMEGPYSQILINSRPIFSGLAGVYGLELIPANMIEKVEVVRSGGSALFGSNAIAGTINIILKDPMVNSYEVGANLSSAGIGIDGDGGPASDYSVNFNASLVSDDHKSGLSLYGFKRDRDMYDANGDGFSETALMNNLTVGTRFFHRFGYRNKLSIDYFTIVEEREGGNKPELPLHERDVAEAVKHDLNTAAITYEQFFREYDVFSVYASGQFLNRNSYYGANKSLSDYGYSKDRTYNIGAQYKASFEKSSLVAGAENVSGHLVDEKLGYPDYDQAVIVDGSIVDIPHTGNTTIANQSLMTSGVFAQYEYRFFKGKIALGGRYDHYNVSDHSNNTDNIKDGDVFSPRVSFMYRVFDELQARISYSQGYRAPQIFDEDLHIETSGSRQVINVNDPDLKQESSHSIMTSMDYNGLIGTLYTGLLVEAFYTRLSDPFVNDIGLPNDQGRVIYTRKNAEKGAAVQGINLEFKLIPLTDFSLTSGFTVQSSKYDVAQEFDETHFFRTPNRYGYFALDWDFAKGFCFSGTGNYTGKMLVPYFGTATDPDIGELRESKQFFDLGMKLEYTVKINGARFQCFGGMKNIFNSYQSDFDIGAQRDPSYVYGPVGPRTVYVGVKFGNMLGK